MAHVAKYTKGSIGGLTSHFERRKNENGEYFKFKNQDIDFTKTNLNYNLAENIDQREFIKKRLSEVKCLNREDVKVMCSWVVTKPKDVIETEQRKFFEESYNFLKNRYGEKNVISSYVHLDEVTPHLHFVFIPVVNDKKKNIEKVSAKECINKRDLQTFHKDFDNHMTRVFSRDIGILNEATKEGNKSIEELKRKSAVEKIEEIKEITKNNIDASSKALEQAKAEASKIVQKANEELKHLKSEIRVLQGEYRAKKAYVDVFANQDDVFKGVIIKKTLTGKTKSYEVSPEKFEKMNITYMDMLASEKMRETTEKTIENYQKSTSYQNILNMKRNFEKEIKDLKAENKGLFKENESLQETVSRISKVFKNSPKIENAFYEIEKRINEQELQQKQKRSHDFGHER